MKPLRWLPVILLLGILPTGLHAETNRDSLFKIAKPVYEKQGGNFSLGVRSTYSLFGDVMTSGAAFTNMAAPVRLDEMKIMAGLGWNLRLWKPKKSDSYKPVLIDRNK